MQLHPIEIEIFIEFNNWKIESHYLVTAIHQCFCYQKRFSIIKLVYQWSAVMENSKWKVNNLKTKVYDSWHFSVYKKLDRFNWSLWNSFTDKINIWLHSRVSCHKILLQVTLQIIKNNFDSFQDVGLSIEDLLMTLEWNLNSHKFQANSHDDSSIENKCKCQQKRRRNIDVNKSVSLTTQ